MCLQDQLLTTAGKTLLHHKARPSAIERAALQHIADVVAHALTLAEHNKARQ
jgi:hypothetical protein